MFQDVGAKDEVVTTTREALGQVDALEIGAFHPAIPGRGLGGGGGIAFDSIHRTAESLRQMTAQNAGAGAQIQHPAGRLDQAGELGQGILAIRIQGTAIDVGHG